MKLSELLDEVKLGEETVRKEKTSKELIESFDEDLNNYKISSLISALNNKFIENVNEETSSVIKNLRKIENKIKMTEDRIENHGYISESYAKMKYDNLSEDFKALSDNIRKKKVQRQMDKDSLGHAVALVIYEAKKLSREGSFDFSEKDFPVYDETFYPTIKSELKLIEENLGY